METLLRIILPVILLLLLWSASQTATLLPHYGVFALSSLLAIAAFLVACVLAVLFAVLPAISLYSLENNGRARVSVWKFLAVWNPSKRQVLSYVTLAYAMTIFLFAVVFLLISNADQAAFAPTLPSMGAASYFSIVTIATVGYGDIQPVSGWARFSASTEILVGVAYTVLFFSVVAGFLREKDR
jgi:voltage-gated potassium channel